MFLLGVFLCGLALVSSNDNWSPPKSGNYQRSVQLQRQPAEVSAETNEFDCKSRTDGNYQDTKSPCSSRYFACSGGHALLRSCGDGMSTRFDVVTNACLFPQFVQACGGTPTTTTGAPSASIFQDAPEGGYTDLPEFDCTGLNDWVYENPIGTCSSHYVRCVRGAPFYWSCPAGLKFDTVFGNCLEQNLVKVCGGTPLQFDCASKADGNYAKKDEPCSSIFFSCVGSLAFARRCPSTLKYDSKTDKCLKTEFVEACGGTSTPEPPKEKIGFDCSKLAPGFYGNPKENCSQSYFACDPYQQAFAHVCPPNLFFDRELRTCLMQRDIPECSGKPRTQMPFFGPPPPAFLASPPAQGPRGYVSQFPAPMGDFPEIPQGPPPPAFFAGPHAYNGNMPPPPPPPMAPIEDFPEAPQAPPPQAYKGNMLPPPPPPMAPLADTPKAPRGLPQPTILAAPPQPYNGNMPPPPAAPAADFPDTPQARPAPKSTPYGNSLH